MHRDVVFFEGGDVWVQGNGEGCFGGWQSLGRLLEGVGEGIVNSEGIGSLRGCGCGFGTGEGSGEETHGVVV